jgi:uncharacterized protein
MSRLLVVVVIFIAIYLLLKYYRKQLPKKDAPGEDTSRHSENMVRCAHCGVHLPKGESIVVDQKYYCSEVHRRAHTDEPA